jgi:hypothetical protein
VFSLPIANSFQNNLNIIQSSVESKCSNSSFKKALEKSTGSKTFSTYTLGNVTGKSHIGKTSNISTIISSKMCVKPSNILPCHFLWMLIYTTDNPDDYL